MKILVVDDDPILARRISSILTEHRHRVQTVASAAAAEALVASGEWDCLIVDWMLPDGTGIDLIRHLRGQKREFYIYCIMVTANSGREARHEGMAAGADDFLNKPLDAEELMLRIRVAMRISQLQQQLASRNHELALTKRRLEEDLHSAASVQRDLLPPPDFSFPGAEVRWYLESCEALGGDLVTLLPIDDRHLGFAVIDVVGHGVKAAILGVQISRRLRPAWNQLGAGLSGDILAQPTMLARLLNHEFPMDYRNLQFFTMCYGVLDTIDGRCSYVGCGHPPPFLLDADGAVSELPVKGHPIGVLGDDDAVFEEQHFILRPGEQLLLLSDGIPESVNGDGELLGMEGLRRQIIGSTDPDDLLRRCSATTREWIGSDLLNDDCTALVIKRSS